VLRRQTIQQKSAAYLFDAFRALSPSVIKKLAPLIFVAKNRDVRTIRDRFHGRYPPNINEGTHPISVKGPTQYQVVPVVF